MPHVRSTECLDLNRSALLVIDLQEKLLPVVPSGEAVVQQTCRLLDAAAELQIPVVATVQYPKGLGPLVPPIAQRVSAPEEKLEFSESILTDADESILLKELLCGDLNRGGIKVNESITKSNGSFL